MSNETKREKLDRVRGMANDHGGTWDLSDNDMAALRAVLRDHDDLLAACRTFLKYATKRDGSPADFEDVMMTFVEDGSTLTECLDAVRDAVEKAESRS